jgi:hypothetical protein
MISVGGLLVGGISMLWLLLRRVLSAISRLSLLPTLLR